MTAPPSRGPGDARRRDVLLAGAASAALGACALPATVSPRPPIVFMHGSGDSPNVWLTTVWRFESNGWPRERLHAVAVPYPTARDDDTVEQPGRSSAAENRRALADAVEQALSASGATRVVLIANSRGGNAVRDYIAHDPGAARVSDAILCGTPSHGVFSDPLHALGSEFNGAGPFLAGLNHAQGPDGAEVTPGVRWMTLRSDRSDKYAQPDGAFLGRPGQPTHVDADAPALRGALNVVLPGVDHRETAFSAAAFAQMWRFLTGTAPSTTDVAPEARPVLDGTVVGSEVWAGPRTEPTNRPLAGATVEVFLTHPDTGERLGPAVHRKTLGANGRWGPLAVSPTATLEFVVDAPDHARTHVYRSPFPRGTGLAVLRAERLSQAQAVPAAIVAMWRPRGYFGVPRDRVGLAGVQPVPGLAAGVPAVSTVSVTLPDAPARSVVGEFNGERIVARTWPAQRRELTVLELTG